ncbi:hypothetical protein E2C01_065443 [Portunus trituberculatus]|uniref:Uncharacterized protein n=1 Tax=Portunus trituberculatus TaxID=210409 RepID=A0A5B7HLX0_PORTR|nr:hypothetical protein [Portunus trituberculatus]
MEAARTGRAARRGRVGRGWAGQGGVGWGARQPKPNNFKPGACVREGRDACTENVSTSERQIIS